MSLQLRAAGFDHIQRHESADKNSLVAAEQSSIQSVRDVVVDSSNLTKEERIMWISAAKQACPNLSIVTVVCGIMPTGENVRFQHDLAYRHHLWRENPASIGSGNRSCGVCVSR